ncbi:MAG: DUF547 domain-containing protein [Aureliella sp.]
MKKDASEYYGGFFWLAAISFVVPIVVAYAAFDKLRPTTKPTPAPDASGVDHQLWDYLLRTYVEDGLIDYEGLSKDYLFTTYLNQIAGCQPNELHSDAERLALHCNAYNALVMQGVINHKIHRNEKNVLSFTPSRIAKQITTLEEKIKQAERTPGGASKQIGELQAKVDRLRADSQFFRLKEHVFANQTISLDHLEQQMIRPVFNEPRIHVALVCAARSCPAIRPEAFTGERLEFQLQDQSIQFANDPRYVSVDTETGALRLSPILSWYESDWDSVGGYLRWLQELVQDSELKNSLSQAASGSIPVQFNEYDWTLNSQEGGISNSSHSSSDFGSGSVPNE